MEFEFFEEDPNQIISSIQTFRIELYAGNQDKLNEEYPLFSEISESLYYKKDYSDENIFKVRKRCYSHINDRIRYKFTRGNGDYSYTFNQLIFDYEIEMVEKLVEVNGVKFKTLSKIKIGMPYVRYNIISPYFKTNLEIRENSINSIL